MWVTEKGISLPRTKTFFYITSTDNEPFFVKPGKAFAYRNNAWIQIKAIGLLDNKIDRVVVSPNGSTSLHLPKCTGLLAVHENHGDAVVITLPLPKDAPVVRNSGAITALDAIAPSGEALIITCPHRRVGDIPFVFGQYNKMTSDFPQRVRGLSISENGRALALAVDNQLWVWQQLPEELRGSGFWTDLTSDQRFAINIEANHPYSQQGKIYHGFMRPRQYFTLHPALAPNLPQNSAIAYQDLCMFDNPDEGVGVVCLTALLPPCRPFDTLYLFVSICTFKGLSPVFQRSDVTLPVIEGQGGPCIFWSLDCRIAVIAVSQSLVIVTRFLRVINVIPLKEIFAGNDPVVASIAWSCSGQFFVITSTLGKIGVVTRCGKSLKHKVCSLAPFADHPLPLMVAGDSKDPSFFIIYSGEKMKHLRIDVSLVEQNLENLMSLHFPQKSVAKMIKPAIKSIQQNGGSSPLNIVRLLYYTDLFRIFPYHSPLRYLIFSLVNDALKELLDSHHDILVYFLIRCVFRLTETPVSIYNTYMERLTGSRNRRDEILRKILEDELNKKDYVISRQIAINDRITFYEPTDEDKEIMLDLKQPHHGRNLDIFEVVRAAKAILYEETVPDISSLQVDFRLLLELMIQYGHFDKVMILSRHPSIACNHAQLFVRIAALHSTNAPFLFKALQACIASAPQDEFEIRAVCVRALTNVLKQRIADSAPSARQKAKFLSSLISVEETLELVVPENIDQCNDFAVILGIAFCACDFPACSNFFNGRIQMIPDQLRSAVREIFGIVWFLRWRYAAICDLARTGHATDATLRLLAFPDFVNRKVARGQINAAGEVHFSPDIYALYMGGAAVFERDPAFVDFCAECSNRISPRSLTRVATAALRFCKEQEDIPRSNLLLAAVVSHMVPWLRCGIPRKLVNFPCSEVIPNELLDFEEFILPLHPMPKMQIQTTNIIDTDHHEEEEEVLPPPPRPPPIQEDSSSEGEFIPPPPSPEEDRPIRRKVSPVKRKPKPKPKPKKKHSSRKQEPVTPPRGPSLRLLSLDPNAAPPRQTYIPQYPQYAPQPAQVQQQQPIWDIDFNNFVKKKAPQREDKPTQQHVEPPPPPSQKQPLIIFGSTPGKAKNNDDFDISDTSSLSDIPLDEPRQPNLPPINPFPIDDGLHHRIETLLDDTKATDPADLPPPPEFKRVEIKPKPIPKPVKIPTAMPEGDINTNASNIPPISLKSTRVSTSARHAEGPDWRPSVVSMRDARIIGVQEISIDTFRHPPPTGTGPQLREIQPTNKSQIS